MLCTATSLASHHAPANNRYRSTAGKSPSSSTQRRLKRLGAALRQSLIFQDDALQPLLPPATAIAGCGGGSNGAPTLKQRIAAGEMIVGINVPLRPHTTKEQIEAAIEAHDVSVDFLFLDGQHSPLNEETVARLCGYAHDLSLPMHFRIKHTQHTYLVGNMLDLGPALIEVPQVETIETAQDAVENFYFRNWTGGRGRRSFGGNKLAWNPEQLAGRLDYTDWWNKHGMLCIQLESINAYTNADKLAVPGVDLLTWGPADTCFDLEAHPEHPFKTPDDCLIHAMAVVKAAGLKTKFSVRTGDTAALGHGLTGAAARQHYLDLGVTVFMETGGY